MRVPCEGRGCIFGFANAFVKSAGTVANATKIETQRGAAQFSESLGQCLHDFVVHRAAVHRCGWQIRASAVAFAGCWNAISSGPAGPSISVFFRDIHAGILGAATTPDCVATGSLSGDLTGAPNRHNNTAVATKGHTGSPYE